MAVEEVKFVVVKSDSSDSLIQKGNQFVMNNCPNREAAVILKLERPVVVHTIRFTNNKSAFIEILAASEAAHSHFNVLVPVLPILSPENSKALKKCDRSLELKRDQFSGRNRSKAVNYIQIICSQPFNKNVPFGLEDVHIFGKEAKNNDLQPNMGKFHYYTDNRIDFQANLFDSYNMDYKKSLMRLYEKRPQNVDIDKKKIHSDNEEDNDSNKKEEDKKRKLAKNDEKSSTKKSTKTKNTESKDTQRKSSSSSSSAITVKAKVKTEITDEPNEKSSKKAIIKHEISDEADNNSKAKASSLPSSSSKSDILSGVVFVLSGYENPQRSQLRDIAVGMGAHYQSKWDEYCTHLICAFPNTPKYSDVQRLNGRIVTGKWIMDCHKSGKLLKWQNYELKSDDTSPENVSKTETKAVLDSKESQDKNDNSGQMIDTNGKHNSNTDKDRKRKAVKRERDSDSENNHHGHGDDDDGGRGGDRDRDKHNKRTKTKKEHLNASKMDSKKDKQKIYARECDSDVIYELDTEDELS